MGPYKENIENMSVSELVSLIDEVNKPPGGIRALHEIAIHSFITPKSRILEVGCNTGYSSLELKRLTGAEVIGIDVNGASIEKAKIRAKREDLDVRFIRSDATKMDFDNEFDLVFCSNATSFMQEKQRAMKNYKKALKTYGFLASIPIYYVKQPSKSMLKQLSKELNVTIRAFDRRYWLNLFADKELELCYEHPIKFERHTEKEVSEYIKEYYMTKPQVRRFDQWLRALLINSILLIKSESCS
jgi:ubiquinone/menaquinone biosynthesis C-methylase UbiE